MHGDIGQCASAASRERLPGRAVVAAAIDVSAAEVAVGGIDDAVVPLVVRDRRHPAGARARRELHARLPSVAICVSDDVALVCAGDDRRVVGRRDGNRADATVVRHGLTGLHPGGAKVVAAEEEVAAEPDPVRASIERERGDE